MVTCIKTDNRKHSVTRKFLQVQISIINRKTV